MLAKYTSDFYQDTPAIVEHDDGLGKGYYLACRTDYDLLEKFYEEIASDLIPELPICKSSSKVSIQVRENENTQYWFVQNFSDKEAKIKLDKELLDLIGGKKDKGEVVLKPFESKVYGVE